MTKKFRCLDCLFIALWLVAGATHAHVAVDIGHSVARAGSQSASGISEFSFNQRLGLSIAAALEKTGLKATVINADGSVTGLVERTTAARAENLFLSVHHDSVQQQFLPVTSSHYSGFSLWLSRKNPHFQASVQCAGMVADSLIRDGYHPSIYHADPVHGEGRTPVDIGRGIFLNDDLIVLKTAQSAAILLEAGVIVNPLEEASLRDPKRIAGQADAVARGIRNCF